MTALLYFTAFLNVGLGFYVFISKMGSRANRLFFGLSAGIAGWAVSNALFQDAPDPTIMYLWAIIAYQIAGAMLFFVRQFSYAVSDSEIKIKSNISTVFAYVALLFSLVAPAIPNIVATGVDFEHKAITAGVLQPVLFVCYLFLIFDGLSRLRKGIKMSPTQIKKIQLTYVFYGLLGAIITGVTTNIILPAVGSYVAVALGPSFTLILLVLIAYSILRHRLFDIRVLIGRITYYLTVGFVPFVAFFLLAWLYIQLFGSIFDIRVYLLSPFVAVLFVALFNFLNTYIRTQVNSRLINPGYDPLTTVEKLSAELSLIIDLPTITQRINEVIQRTIRPEYEAVLVFPQYDESGNKTADFRAFHSQTKDIPDPDKFMTIVSTIWQSLGRYPIVFDELEEEMTRGAFRNIPNLVKDLKPLMEQINAKVILSIGDKENIKGMFVVGPKEADYPYSSQDIDFLKSIANSGGLAIERSLLYGEVQEFANTLQGKVDQATADLKQANTDLQAALEQLQEARRQERDMMDVMGHELRTPITIVRNALSMLSRERDKTGGNIPPEHLSKYLDMAIESLRREITLIETLLSATKIDGARMQIYSTKVDFTDVVNDAIEGQKTIAAQKGIQINYTVPANQIFVYSDRTRVQEVMDNFLSNAVKYTLKGAVNIDIWQDDKYGWISVKDSGIGISAEDLQNLGKKFFRAKQYVGNNDTDSGGKVVRPGGTGLGLYVTFDLIKVMGGELYINSKVGEGSAFTFSMPLYTNQPDQQFDQTFDNQKKTVERTHIHLNEELPKKP